MSDRVMDLTLLISSLELYSFLYNSGCQIGCNWSTLKPGLNCQHTKVPCHR